MGNPFGKTAQREQAAGNGARKAAPGTLNFLRDLMLQKAAVTGRDMAEATEAVDNWLPGLTQEYASEQIDKLKEQRRNGWVDVIDGTEAAAAIASRIDLRADIEDGYYFLGDDVVKVIHAIHGSGFQYARRARIITPKVTHADGSVTAAVVDWEKVPGLLNEVKMHGVNAASDPELIAKFGEVYGRCSHCWTPLTNPLSIERGIGPDCWVKYGHDLTEAC